MVIWGGVSREAAMTSCDQKGSSVPQWMEASKCAALCTTVKSALILFLIRLPCESLWEGGELAGIRSNHTRGTEGARSFRGAGLSRWQGKEFGGEGGGEAAT